MSAGRRAPTRRARWRRAVVEADLPAHLEPMRRTLLRLVPLMDAHGRLCAWGPDMAQAARVPRATLYRHLERAGGQGETRYGNDYPLPVLLRHESRGGKGRKGVYHAVIPGEETPPEARSVSHARDTETKISVPCPWTLTTRSVSQTYGTLRKNYASDSEHLAVDEHRGRRSTDDAAGTAVVPFVSNTDRRSEAEPAHRATTGPQGAGEPSAASSARGGEAAPDGADRDTAKTTTGEAAGFAEWWAAYPRKTNRARAFAAYRQALAVTTPAVLLAAVHAATRAGAWPEEVRYIPAAASWLRDQRWTDEHPKPKSEIPPWERFA